jgi:hypothetical protein
MIYSINAWLFLIHLHLLSFKVLYTNDPIAEMIFAFHLLSANLV